MEKPERRFFVTCPATGVGSTAASIDNVMTKQAAAVEDWLANRIQEGDEPPADRLWSIDHLEVRLPG